MVPDTPTPFPRTWCDSHELLPEDLSRRFDLLVGDAAQALSEVRKAEVRLADAKAQGKGAEHQLDATLDELERLKNALAAATNDLAASQAANHHARSVLHSVTITHQAGLWPRLHT